MAVKKVFAEFGYRHCDVMDPDRITTSENCEHINRSCTVRVLSLLLLVVVVVVLVVLLMAGVGRYIQSHAEDPRYINNNNNSNDCNNSSMRVVRVVSSTPSSSSSVSSSVSSNTMSLLLRLLLSTATLVVLSAQPCQAFSSVPSLSRATNMLWLLPQDGYDQPRRYRRNTHSLQSNRFGRASLDRSRLYSSNNHSADLERQREETAKQLETIQSLESALQESSNDDDDNNTDDLLSAVQELQNSVNQQSLLHPVPPEGLSTTDFNRAIQSFLRMPRPVQKAFCDVLERDYPVAIENVPDLIAQAYTDRDRLTQQRMSSALDAIQKAYQQGQGRRIARAALETFLQDMSGLDTTTTDNKDDDDDAAMMQELSNLLNDNSSNGNILLQADTNRYLPRVVRQDEGAAQEKDLKALERAIADSGAFTVQGEPIKIDGGYLLVGRNVKENGQDCVEAIQKSLPRGFPATVSLQKDFRSVDVNQDASVGDIFQNDNISWDGLMNSVGEQMDREGEALLLLRKDFTPGNSVVGTLAFLAAITTTFITAIDSYGANESVSRILNDALALDDYGGLDWFNTKLLTTFVPLLVITAVHELGHFVVAKRDNVSICTCRVVCVVCVCVCVVCMQTMKRDDDDDNHVVDGYCTEWIASCAFFFFCIPTTTTIRALLTPCLFRHTHTHIYMHTTHHCHY